MTSCGLVCVNELRLSAVAPNPPAPAPLPGLSAAAVVILDLLQVVEALPHRLRLLLHLQHLTPRPPPYFLPLYAALWISV